MQNQRDERKTVSRSASKVIFGSLLGTLAGLLSQITIAALFGVGLEMDAYITALAVPLYAQAVFLAGLSFVFIPTFVEMVQHGEEDVAWQLIGTFFWVIGLFLLVLTISIALFATPIINVIAPGLGPEKSQLAAGMLMVLSFSIIFNGYSVFTVGIQNARNQFFWPATGGAVNSLVAVVVLLVLYRPLGSMALAWSFLVAIAAQALVTVIPVIRHGWQGTLAVTDPRVREVLMLMAPFIILGLFTRLTPLLQRFFASGLPDGDLSYLGYATKTSRMVQSLLGATIVTAIFPVFSRRYTLYGIKGLFPIYRYGMRLTTAVGLPVLAIISVLAVPLISLLFERGAFDRQATLSVARVMPLILTSTLLLPMIGNLLTRVLYVTKDTRSAPIISAVAVIFYIPAAYIGSQYWGYMGLAIADVAYTVSGITAILVLLYLRYGAQILTARASLVYVTKYLTAAILAGMLAWVSANTLQIFGTFVQFATSCLVGGATYMAIMFVFDREIMRAIIDILGAGLLMRISGKRTSRPVVAPGTGNSL